MIPTQSRREKTNPYSHVNTSILNKNITQNNLENFEVQMYIKLLNIQVNMKESTYCGFCEWQSQSQHQ